MACEDLVVVLRRTVLLCLAAGATALELEEERLDRLLDTDGGLGVLLGAVERLLDTEGGLGVLLGAVERVGGLDEAGRPTLVGPLGALRAEVLGVALREEEACFDDVLACEALPDLLACAKDSMLQRARINTAIITDFLIPSLFMIASFL